jgi:hypothetical protein
MWLYTNAAIVLPALQETRIANPEWARRHIRENLPAIYAQCREVKSSTENSVNELVPEQKSQSKEPPDAGRSRFGDSGKG